MDIAIANYRTFGGIFLKKSFWVGLGMSSLTMSTLLAAPQAVKADNQAGTSWPTQSIFATQPSVSTGSSANTTSAASTTGGSVPVTTKAVAGNNVTVTVQSTDPSLNGKTFTQKVDPSTIYPVGNANAQSVLDSVNAIINGSLAKLVQGQPNAITAITIGLPGTILNMLGNVTSSTDVFRDIKYGIDSIIKQFNTQFPLGIISDMITGLGNDVSGVAGFLSDVGIKINLTGLQSKTEDATPTNSTKLPIIKLAGNEFLADKSNHSMMTFNYNDPKTGQTETGYAETNWSGSSTQLLPKKSYKVKLYKDAGEQEKLKLKLFPDADKTNTYQLKANETDPTMARNLVNADVWKTMISSEPNLPKKLQAAPNLGSVEGLPILVFVNGKGRGVYDLTTDKSGDLWGMSKKKDDDVAIQGNVNNAPAEMFDQPTAKVDETDFSSENADEISDKAKTNLNQFIKFVSTSSDSDFVAHLKGYADVNSIIDYYLFLNIFGAHDQIAKNATYLSYDEGKTWRMEAYDNDLTLRNNYFGFGIDSPYQMFYDATRGGIFPTHNTLLKRMGQLFKDQITSRYQQLRQTNVISADTINDKYVDFMSKVGYDNYLWDQAINPLEFNQYTQSLQELENVVTKRVQILDKYFNYSQN